MARGRPKGSKNRKISPFIKIERNALICERLRAGGITMAQLSREYGLTNERVRQIALRGGVTAATYEASLPPSKNDLRREAIEDRREERREKRADILARILMLRQKGLNQRDIGRAVGMKQNHVSTILIQAGHRTSSNPVRTFAPLKRRRRSRNAMKVGAPKVTGLSKSKQIPHAPEVVKSALDLWLAGLSAQLIALRLTTKDRPMSKNVIIGLAHRNDFPPRPSPIRA